MRFRLSFTTELDNPKLYLRAILRYADGTPVTMVTTKEPFSAKKDAEQSIVFRLDSKYIVPGKYTLSLILYEVNQYGTYRNCDGVKDAFCFEIKAEEDYAHRMEWSHRYWGHVSLGDILIEKE